MINYHVKKIIGSILFLILVFFNINIFIEDDGIGINLIKDALASTEVPSEGNGGGTTKKPTYFANFGTVIETRYCQKTTIGLTGLQIEYWFAQVYWLQEYCVYGGNFVECTYGTGRRTYQGGGC